MSSRSNLRTQNVYYRICGESSHRKAMYERNEPFYLDDYVYCYYYNGKNVIADNGRDVSRYFGIGDDIVKSSVCKIRNIDIDLTNQNIKQLAEQNERNRK